MRDRPARARKRRALLRGVVRWMEALRALLPGSPPDAWMTPSRTSTP